MSDLNQCNFIGRLGQDVEVKQLPSGKDVGSFSLAVGEKWKGQDGQTQEHTEWVRVNVFGALAGICQKYLSKGSQVFVSGKMRTRKWQDQSGADRYSTEIVAKEVQILTWKDDNQKGRSAPSNDGLDDFDEQIPF